MNMKTRVYLDIEVIGNDIKLTTGGGICNDGQPMTHNSLSVALKDLEERAVVEYHRAVVECNTTQSE
jgi:hypothetical protein